jgi:hypothetical protein
MSEEVMIANDETRAVVFPGMRRQVAAAVSVCDLAAEREAARVALERTEEELKSGDLARAGAEAVGALEESVAGKPEAADPGAVIARVVAVGDRKEGLPAVPLEGLKARLRIGERTVAEATTDRVGLVALPIGEEKGSYELEVLGPDCVVMACQPGRLTGDTPPPHLVELPRTEALKPPIERAAPFEAAILKARDRAAIAERVMTKALLEQARALSKYIAEIDAGSGGTGGDVRPVSTAPVEPPSQPSVEPRPSPPRTEPKASPPPIEPRPSPPPVKPRPAQPPVKSKPTQTPVEGKPGPADSATRTRQVKPPQKRGRPRKA